MTVTIIFLPLGLPGDEAEGGVEEPAHLRQQTLSVDADEEVWGRGVLEGHVHRLSKPARQIRTEMVTVTFQRNRESLCRKRSINTREPLILQVSRSHRSVRATEGS